MLKKAINIVAVSGAYIATLIGAGFASGQEILQFFIKYGAVSILGVALVSVIFGLTAYSVLERAGESKIDSFKGYLQAIMPTGPASAVEFAVFVLMLAVFSVMAAGCGESLAQLFSVPVWIGVGMLCLFCLLCLLFDAKAILAVNGVLAPVIVLGIVFVCVYILKFREISVFSGNFSKFADNWAVSGISYASYNVLTAIAVLVGLRKNIQDKNSAKWTGIISGIVFFVIMSLLWAVLKIYYGKIELGEIPVLTLVMRQGKTFGLFYTVILIFAMITTAVSNAFGASEQMMSYTGLGSISSAMLVCSVGFLGAGLGFEVLVSKGYKLFGYLGIAVVIAIIKDFLKIMKK